MRQYGHGKRLDIVWRDEVAAPEQGKRLGRPQQRERCAGAGTHIDVRMAARRVCEVHHVTPNQIVDEYVADSALNLEKLRL